jgi:DNA-binding MarR family transcriptional regulator
MREPRRYLAAGKPAQREIAAYNFQDQVGFLLRKAYQWHSQLFQHLCPDKELTTAQFAVLCAVRDGETCSLTDICRSVVMDPATTRGIVTRLSERSLVTLEQDSIDRRRLVVGLSAKGRDLLRRIIPHAIAITQATLEPLNPAEQVALVHLLRKLPNAGDTEDDDVTPSDGKD